MDIVKINGIASPYRSKTFQNQAHELVQDKGILYIDSDVYEDGLDVVVPIFSVIQNGLIFKTEDETNIVKPIELEPPYYLTVSTPSALPNQGATLQFAKSPTDISSNETIIGEYDGVEWRTPARISTSGLLENTRRAIIDREEVGPYRGLITEDADPNYTNSPGLLFDKQGDRVRFDEYLVTPIIEEDIDWERTDRMIYRRPSDTRDRIGVRKIVIGGTYTDNLSKAIKETVLSPGASGTHKKPLILLDSSNNAHFLYIEGFGESVSIRYAKYAEDRTTPLVAPSTLTAASLPDFDAWMDGDDNIHVVTVYNGELILEKFDNVGASISGPTSIYSGSGPANYPTIKGDPLNKKIYVVFSVLEAVDNNQIYFTSRNLSGALVTAPKMITNTTGNLVNSSIDVTDDMLVYITWEDALGNKIYFLITDDIGETTQVPVHVSGNTDSTSFGTLVDGAKNPIIKVAENKQFFIGFLQKKNSTDYGLAIYDSFSGAYLPNYIDSGENFNSFAIDVDNLTCDLQLNICQDSRTDYVKLSGQTVVFTYQLGATGGIISSVKKDNKGSILHFWVNPLPGTFTNIGSPEVVDHIGPVSLSGILNSINLISNQFSMSTSGLSITPSVGQRITISGSSSGNNGSKVITNVSIESLDSADDIYVITCDSNFNAPESPASGVNSQFANPDGSDIRFMKSVGEKDKTRALRMATNESDILLARIIIPGPIILNYLDEGEYGEDPQLYGVYGGTAMDWSATASGEFTIGSGLKIVDLANTITYTVNPVSIAMNNGDALYAIFDKVTTTIDLKKAPIPALPWSQPINILGFVGDDVFHPRLFAVAGMGTLEAGEQIVLGRDLPSLMRSKLGILSETQFEPYTSTLIIGANDSLPSAISKLDQKVLDLGTDVAQEETHLVTNPVGQTIVNLGIIELNPDNSIPDAQVYINNKRYFQDLTGGLNSDFRKNSDTQIEFSFTVPFDAKIVIRNERTGAIIGTGGGTVDLTDINVDIQPDSAGGRSVGTVLKPWKSVLLKDTSNTDVWEIEVDNGVLGATKVI